MDYNYLNLNIYYNTHPQHYMQLTTTLTDKLFKNVDLTDYYFYITRLYIPISSVPLITNIGIQPNQPNPNLTKMKILIDGQNGGMVSSVIFTPTDSTLQPSDPEYYYMYDLYHFIKMVNNALYNAHTGAGIPGDAPYIIFNESNRLFALCATNEYDNATFGGAKIYFNNDLNYYFDFESETVNDYKLIQVYDRKNNVNNNVFTMWQSFATVDRLNDIEGIVVKSRNFYTNREKYITDGGIPYSDDTISDFIINNNELVNVRSPVIYIPPIYRFFNLISDFKDTVDIAIYFLTKKHEYTPIKLRNSSEICDIKIGFKKKKLITEKDY